MTSLSEDAVVIQRADRPHYFKLLDTLTEAIAGQDKNDVLNALIALLAANIRINVEVENWDEVVTIAVDLLHDNLQHSKFEVRVPQ